MSVDVENNLDRGKADYDRMRSLQLGVDEVLRLEAQVKAGRMAHSITCRCENCNAWRKNGQRAIEERDARIAELEHELAALRITASRAMHDYETASQELSVLKEACTQMLDAIITQPPKEGE